MVEVDSTAPARDSTRLADASAPDVQATYCATLVDQWLRLGVRHAVVAPGSRSTPMALALTERDEMSVHVVHDERAAAFVALGLGLDTGSDLPPAPALLLCTSGTAAANFFPAVVEAGLSEIPMIVLTADRPDELRGVGAPQTIDQIDLYGRHVRWSSDPGVADAATAGEWRALASAAWDHAAHGPVQLNLAFREPLVGRAGPLPEPDSVPEGRWSTTPTSADPVPTAFDSERGVILVGGRHGVDIDRVVELGRRTSWPIIADPTSGMRHLADVSTVDALLRSDGFADRFTPDTIVRIGRPSTSKVLAQWTARLDATLIQVGGPGRIDPAHDVTAVCTLDDLLAANPTGATGSGWLDGWRRADAVAEGVLSTHVVSGDTLTEPAVARLLAENLPPGSQLTVSSSMPVRDLEWFGGATAVAHSNRGANGIDGVMSTALGRALGRVGVSAEQDSPEFVLIGDLAFVHDSNALVALTERSVDLRIVVVDNDGGGIFSFLPQATLLEHHRFEQLFATPLGSDVLGVAAAHGVAGATASSPPELIAQLGRPGPWVCQVSTDRAENVLEHARLHHAVVAALTENDLGT